MPQLCLALTCWQGHMEGCVLPPLLLLAMAIMYQALRGPGTAAARSLGRVQGQQNSYQASSKPQLHTPPKPVISSGCTSTELSPMHTDSLFSRVTSCCGLSQESFLSRCGKALAVSFSRSPGYNKKASSGFKAGGFSLLPGPRTKHY